MRKQRTNRLHWPGKFSGGGFQKGRLPAFALLALVFWGVMVSGNSALRAQGRGFMPVPGPPAGRLAKGHRLPPPYDRLQKLQRLSQPSKPATGLRKILVVLIDFPDYTWDTQADSNFYNPVTDSSLGDLHRPEYFQRMLFSLSSFRDPLSKSSYTGSFRDFYRQNSYGMLDVQGTVFGWFRAAHELRYYCNTDGLPNTADDYGLGGGEHSAATLVREAVALADRAADLSQFDGDGDGVVDALFVVHAGPGAEEVYTQNYSAHYDYLWSHQSQISYRSADGVRVDRYTLQPENGTIGVFCHEFGHVLGLPDLYDTDGSSEGIGEWGLMGSGGWCFAPGDRLGTSPAHFCAWSKWRLGWLHPARLAAAETGVLLEPVEEVPRALMLADPQIWAEGGQPQEFFLLENRQLLGFDRGLTRRQVELHKPQPHGLVIYHINQAVTENNNENRRLVDVEEASPVWVGGDWYENLDHPRDLSRYQFLNQGNRGDNGDPFPGFRQVVDDWTDFSGPRTKDTFSDSTHPGSKWSDGRPSGIVLSGIREEGQRILLDVSFSFPVKVANPAQNSRPPETPKLAVYPNPAREHVTIRLPDKPGTRQWTVTIFNALGRRVWQAKSASGILEWFPDTPGSGIYWAVANSGQRRYTCKFVVLGRGKAAR